MSVLVAFSFALAVLNVGLTVYHWRLVRRARERLRASEASATQSAAILAEAHAAFVTTHHVASNGHRPEAEP